MAPERLKKHYGRLAASHLSIWSLLSSSASGFVDRVARLVSDGAAALVVSLTEVLPSVVGSLELDSNSIPDLSCVTERESCVYTNPYTLGAHSSVPLVPGHD